METKAAIEFTHGKDGIIRGGKDFKKFGDPYTFVCSFKTKGDEVYIYAACSANSIRFTKDMFKAIAKVLDEVGIRHATWERLNNGHREVKYSLKIKEEKEAA